MSDKYEFTGQYENNAENILRGWFDRTILLQREWQMG